MMRTMLIAAVVAGAGSMIAAGDDDFEVFAKLPQGPGNLTVTPAGDVIVSLHQFYETEARVVKVSRDGEMTPYPNEAWAVGGAVGDRLTLDSVLGIQSDTMGIVWMLDNGMRSGITPKLVGWDSRRDRLVRVVHLPPPITPKEGAFVNDLAVDTTHNTIYIADPANGPDAALIVVDLSTGHARRVLEGHRSVVPEDEDLIIDGSAVEILLDDGEVIRPRVGVNPIALDAQNQWLYYGPMHGRTLYRIRAADLRDPSLSPEELEDRIERYADKPLCDGISIDRSGNIYISDLASNAIGMIDADREYRIRYQDPTRLAWPDAFAFGPDGWMYVVSNQLHRSKRLNAGETAVEPPFYINRFRPRSAGTVGR